MSLQLQIPQHFLAGWRRNEFPPGSLITFITITQGCERGRELICGWGSAGMSCYTLWAPARSWPYIVFHSSRGWKWVPPEVSKGVSVSVACAHFITGSELTAVRLYVCWYPCASSGPPRSPPQRLGIFSLYRSVAVIELPGNDARALGRRAHVSLTKRAVCVFALAY